MISVLTLTYQRHHLLEEAMESFLKQDFSGESEMVIINDSNKVNYVFDHPKIRIINTKERFPSVGLKLNFGFSQCKYNYIYRLDDDDLMAPWALRNTWEDILNHPDYDIYRSNGHYYFENNDFRGVYCNVNNGNVYTKKYLSSISIPDRSFGEDYAMTFNFNAKIYESERKKKTMIYRVGMNTYHISGMGDIGNTKIKDWTDRIVSTDTDAQARKGFEEGIIELHPHFKNDYYKLIDSED